MRVWLVMFLGTMACTSDPEPADMVDPTGEPPMATADTGEKKEPTETRLATLQIAGQYELRGTDWTGVETITFEVDDLFNPETLCVINYDVTGTDPRNDCKDCNASPEGMGGAHSFVTSNASIETESFPGACDLALATPPIGVTTLAELDNRTLHYGWGEELTGHGYALFRLNDDGNWFFRVLMGYPWEDDGTFAERGIDAEMVFFLFEGTHEI